MHFNKAFLLTLIIFITPTFAAAEFIPFSPSAVETDLPDISYQSRGDSLTIDIGFPGLTLTEVEKDPGLFNQLTLSACGLKGSVGNPYLPFKGIFVEVPAGAAITMSVDTQTLDPMYTDQPILPRQKPDPEVYPEEPREFMVNSKIYTSTNALPKSLVEITEDGFIRGRRVLFLEISPIQYIPATGELIVHTHISVNLSMSGKVSMMNEVRKQRLASDVFNRQSANLILNYEPVEPLKSQRDGADYLIITADDFADELEPLLEWKTLKGYQTSLVTLSEIGSSSSAIKNYIQNAYNTWNPAPTYILLVGDINRLASNTVSPDAYGYPFPSGSPLFPPGWHRLLPRRSARPNQRSDRIRMHQCCQQNHRVRPQSRSRRLV